MCFSLNTDLFFSILICHIIACATIYLRHVFELAGVIVNVHYLCRCYRKYALSLQVLSLMCTVFAGVIANVHYLHFAIILACITFVVTVGVSIMTEPRKEKQVSTWLLL